MDLSQIKMVVTDMDGTLLNSNHEVSPRFFEIFTALQQKNIQFVAASGRQYHSIVDKLKPIKEEILVIAENGALVKDKDRELLVTPIQQDLKDELLEVIDQIEGAHAMLCGKYNAYFDGRSAAFLGDLKEYYSNYEIHESLKDVTDEIIKIAVYHNQNAETHIYPALKDLEHLLKVKVSGLYWVDLNHSDAHKGYALEKLMKAQGLSSNEVMVFGDYNNDLEMLELSDYSFAMANAHPNVKKVAKFNTASNDDFGVERILEQLI
ncbi:HAD family hydrolase [Flagellimonas myxillae]|uniref:HAD family hydrolase n=1 Tax=Flagellimonas myxillae TaxID=2942214 RepID=UPI00201EFDF2|nr:HAD family hydrolase [Muricauda myxillae]MCL6267856.1 Cof-type HAD-IIB family hydrolase [Muricauda myxillae]